MPLLLVFQATETYGLSFCYMRRLREVLPGDKFEWLTILSESERRDNVRYFLCECRCGKRTIVRLGKLTTGHTKSCGCYLSFAKSKPEGETRVRDHELYHIWDSMKKRCSNPSNQDYPNYGGRGISVCDKWKQSFFSFVEDAGDRPSKMHSIDRINVDGNYEPGNIKWATQKEQQRNRRNNVNIKFLGHTKCITEWAEILGITRHKLRSRIQKLGPVEALKSFI